MTTQSTLSAKYYVRHTKQVRKLNTLHTHYTVHTYIDRHEMKKDKNKIKNVIYHHKAPSISTNIYHINIIVYNFRIFPFCLLDSSIV